MDVLGVHFSRLRANESMAGEMDGGRTPIGSNEAVQATNAGIHSQFFGQLSETVAVVRGATGARFGPAQAAFGGRAAAPLTKICSSRNHKSGGSPIGRFR